ncbi:MAG: CGGC domain-containing protein [Saccharofermentanales bacterium]|jgi:predicted metal-binding protein
MKKIAILTCLSATSVCSSAACFSALNQRKATFQRYLDDDVEIVAFFHCNGCDCDYGNDKKYLEKIRRICEIKPDAVHIGVCAYAKGVECPNIAHVIQTLEASGIDVIRGTHN